MNIGGVIETASWKDKPDAILLVWQGGQEGGNAAADILIGKVNPSGKLPMTFPIDLRDHASNSNFPLEGIPMSIVDFIFPRSEQAEEEKIRNQDYTIYEESIYVGYRHFDKKNLEVSYPFGYGLSYSQFGLSNSVVEIVKDTIKISVSIQNQGQMAGKEVVQAYFTKHNSTIDRPIQELKSFKKTKSLEPGDSEEIFLKIPVNELSYWNENSSIWKIEKGIYQIRLGFSSRDIRVKSEIEI
jgi:beta-glucosidase